MNTLFLDCNAGISGDMTVAALLDAGADRDVLQNALATIPIGGFKTEITKVKKNAIVACDFNVILEHENHDHDMHFLFGEENHENHCSREHHHEHHAHHHEHRGLAEINEIIDNTKISVPAKNLAKKIFDILADAEARVHGVPKNDVHFHEVGAVDSIVDIIAIAVCFDNLQISKVYSTPLTEGTGTIRCAHGILSIPVPAVVNILATYKMPLSIKNERGEFVTPTGAAFLAAVDAEFAFPQHFVIQKIGLGAGKRDYKTPGVLRAMIIEL